MKLYIEIDLKSSLGIEYIASKLVDFSIFSNIWMYDLKRTEKLSHGLIDQSAIVFAKNHEDTLVTLIFFESTSKCFKLGNILLSGGIGLPIETYNAIALEFFNDLKSWNKDSKFRIFASNSNPDLSEIISAKIPRKAFELFLNNHPLSHHPSDIARLDSFICSVARYAKKSIDVNALGLYLAEQKGWTENQIKWLIDRMEIGLAIISAYQNRL
ncbi:hypothetical protein GNP73_19735 [Aliivibrio fischeri]|uniref:hypothetical protein n=1 Tax=Aliivibrio fischeri TaxID=668 RepID=UPI0012DA16E6|nr:hypothetical protein [Aliivibrio fischeri]MUJ30191.1 hypothetical protein [Aliivibrio fischeri]